MSSLKHPHVRALYDIGQDGNVDLLVKEQPDGETLPGFFGGLTIEETAEVQQVSPATVKNDWALARAWLYRELNSQSPSR